jgi:hypothetical protein
VVAQVPGWHSWGFVNFDNEKMKIISVKETCSRGGRGLEINKKKKKREKLPGIIGCRDHAAFLSVEGL